MSLYKIDMCGERKFVSKVPRLKDIQYLLERFDKSELNEIYDYIRKSLADEKEFSIAKKFGHASLEWNKVPLIYIYHVARGDQALAAQLLGLMVMGVLIEDSNREWGCVKTTIGHRDFATNFYWSAAS